MTPFAYPTVAALVTSVVLSSTVLAARAADIPRGPYYGAPGEIEVYPPAPPPARYGYVPAPQAYYPPPAIVVAPEPYYVPRPVYVYPRYGAYPRYPVHAYGPYAARSYGHYRGWGPGRRW